jgi:hypothetical protein
MTLGQVGEWYVGLSLSWGGNTRTRGFRASAIGRIALFRHDRIAYVLNDAPLSSSGLYRATARQSASSDALSTSSYDETWWPLPQTRPAQRKASGSHCLTIAAVAGSERRASLRARRPIRASR